MEFGWFIHLPPQTRFPLCVPSHRHHRTLIHTQQASGRRSPASRTEHRAQGFLLVRKAARSVCTSLLELQPPTQSEEPVLKEGSGEAGIHRGCESQRPMDPRATPPHASRGPGAILTARTPCRGSSRRHTGSPRGPRGGEHARCDEPGAAPTD